MTTNMIKNRFLPAALVVAVSLASGCSTYKDKRDLDSYTDDMSGVTHDQISRNVDSVTLDAKRASQDVNRPYITGKAIPLSRDVTLPSPLRGDVDVTMLYRDSADLVTLAARIQDATGIPVKVMPDALLPIELFMPRLEQSQNGGGGGGGAAQSFMQPSQGPIVLDSPLPGVGAPLAPMNSNPGYQPNTKKLKADAASPMGRQSLPTTLDAIALRLGVYWKYDSDISALVFYRTETRTFEVRGAEMEGSSEMSIDLSGGVDNSNASGLQSKSKASIDTQSKKETPMAGMIARMSQFMSRSGRIAAGSGGLVVVTDTKAALDQIDAFIKQENTLNSRRIDLVFEEITIQKTTNSNTGVNWNLLFNGGGSGNSVSTSGLNSLIEQEGAALSVGASVGSGPWKGSSIALQALSKVGKIVDQKMNSFGAVNGQPATSGRPERQKYIDKLEQTASNSDANGPTVTVTQAQEVSGRIITVLPYAYADGDINLAVKYDNTPTPTFTKQTLPNGSYVQSPSSVSDVLVRTAIVHSGQPFVISATTDTASNYNEARTDRGAPMLFGGSDVTNHTDRVTVFVLTARVSEK